MRGIKLLVLSFFEQLWFTVLSILVPEYIKKVIFISSVYAVLFELSADDKEAFKKINDKFKLVNNPDTLIPNAIRIAPSIWEQAVVRTLLREAIRVKEHQIEPELPQGRMSCEAISEEYRPALHLAAKLVKSMPSWLRYTKPADQAADILMPCNEKLCSYA
jgi:hypothetical protein